MRDHWKPHTRHRKKDNKDLYGDNPPTGLVLTREVGQRIFIGDNIIITLVDVNNGKAKLCFTAPKDISIDREEIREKVNKEGRR